MEELVSCCGCVCSQCGYYPKDCAGCSAVEGKAFWLAYTGGAVCEIYGCCIQTKGLTHCGRCGELPCARYQGGDPTKTGAENAEDHRMQMERLRRRAEEERAADGAGGQETGGCGP